MSLSNEICGKELPQVAYSWVDRLIDRVLSSMPSKHRRLLFIASLSSLVNGFKNPDAEYVEKINQLLNLAYRTNSLRFPMEVSTIIWKRLKTNPTIDLNGRSIHITEVIKHNLSDEDYVSLAKYFTYFAPKWMVYDQITTIAEDIKLLFKSKMPDYQAV